jgi:hypothetical protein
VNEEEEFTELHILDGTKEASYTANRCLTARVSLRRMDTRIVTNDTGLAP